jgi:hypothetical protein
MDFLHAQSYIFRQCKGFFINCRYSLANRSHISPESHQPPQIRKFTMCLHFSFVSKYPIHYTQ